MIMALSDDVKARIKALEGQVCDISESTREQMKTLEESFRSQSAGIHRQMKLLVEKQEQASMEKFNCQMQELRGDLDKLVQRHIREQQKLEEQNLRKSEQVLAELKREKELLENRIKGMEEYLASAEATGRQKAQEMWDALARTEEEIDRKPHQLFCPYQFETIKKGRTDILRFMDNGMYQSASGQAAIMIADYEQLGVRTDQKYGEWEGLYKYFSALLETISGQINLFNQAGMSTPYQEKIFLSEKEKNYWSQGEYQWMMDYVEKANDLKTMIEWKGIPEYLKSQEGMGLDQLTDMYYDLRIQKNHIYAVLNCISSERYYSDQRYVWGERIAHVLKEADYDLTEMYWEEAAGPMKDAWWYQQSHRSPDGYWENQMGTYYMTFEFGLGDYLLVKIVPIRENGICIRNQCYIMLDMYSSKNARSIENIIHRNIQRISSVICAETLSCGQSEQRYADVERGKKKPASVKEQEKYLNMAGERRK